MHLLLDGLNNLCEMYLEALWHVVTFQPLIRNSSTITSQTVRKALATTATIQESFRHQNSSAILKSFGIHPKFAKAFVASLVAASGVASLTNNPPKTPPELCVLISACLLPLAMHYHNKNQSNNNLSNKDKIIKAIGFSGHVLADAMMIAMGVVLSAGSGNLIHEGLSPALTDKIADVWVVGVTSRITNCDTWWGVTAKLTTNVLAVAALQNGTDHLAPFLAVLYGIMYGAHIAESLGKNIGSRLE